MVQKQTQDEEIALQILNLQKRSVFSRKTDIIPVLLSAISICILDVVVGAMLLWPASALPESQNPNSTITFTQEEGSWIVSLIAVGAIPGAFIAGFLVHKIGRRITALIDAIPFIASWMLIIMGTKAWLFYIARILAGLSLGGACVVIPMYIFEISEPKNRAMFGALFPLSMSFGALMSLLLSTILDYRGIAIALNILCLLFIIIFYFAPESPVYYVIKEEYHLARRSLQILHGERKSRHVLEDLINLVESTTVAEKTTIRQLMKDKAFVRGFFISMGVVASYQLCGMNFVMSYAEKIFKDAGSAVDPKTAAIINFAVQFGAAFLQLFIIERFPRKHLLLQNSIISCITLGTLGIQCLLDFKSGWLPIVCLMVHSTSFVWGFSALGPTLTGELIAPKAKQYAFGASVILTSVLNFGNNKSFPFLNNFLGMGSTFLIFSGFMVLASLHIVFFVPETKGKSLIEIQQKMCGKVRR